MPKIERTLPEHPEIYQVFKIAEGKPEEPTETYRVRKRAKINGKWTTRVFTFKSFGEAKHFSRQKVDLNKTPKVQLFFEDVLARFLHFKEFEERRAPGTIQGYRSRAKHFKFFERLPVGEISARVIDAWVNLLLDPKYKAFQQSSRSNYEHELVLLTAILRFYREFLDEAYVVPIMRRHRKRLCPRRKNQEEIRYLSTAQEQLLLDALRSWPVLHDLALFQLHTGARVGEAAALMFEAVEFSKGLVHIRQHLHWDRTQGGQILVLKGTKAGPDRTVPLTQECLDMLRRRFAERGGAIVFPGTSCESWMAYRRIQAVYDRAFERLGFPHRGTHSLRHTFAVRFLEQTKDVYALQRALGHADLEMTMRYAKYTNDSVRKAFEVFRGGREDGSTVVPNLFQTPSSG